MVRKELIYGLSKLIKIYGEFISPIFLKNIIEETEKNSLGVSQKKSQTSNVKQNDDENKDKDLKGRALGKIGFFAMDTCKIILLLCSDPSHDVSELSYRALNYLKIIVFLFFFIFYFIFNFIFNFIFRFLKLMNKQHHKKQKIKMKIKIINKIHHQLQKFFFFFFFS
jgi:hypothetical protein